MIGDKIGPHHLERKAILYVRQSSAHQHLNPGLASDFFSGAVSSTLLQAAIAIAGRYDQASK